MQVRHLILWPLIYSRGDIMSSDICGNATLQSCPKRESVRIQFRRIASKGKVLRIQFSRIASKEVFWEYNSAELPKRKCENTTLESCLKWNILRIQLCTIASKGSVGIQLRRVALKKIFWEYNSAELPQRKYFEKIQLHRVASKEMFWEYNSVKLP